MPHYVWFPLLREPTKSSVHYHNQEFFITLLAAYLVNMAEEDGKREGVFWRSRRKMIEILEHTLHTYMYT